MTRRESHAVDLGGGVHLLGGTLPLDGRLSWAPTVPDRYVSVACYLLRDGDAAFLIDSGAPIHFEWIASELSRLLEDVEQVTLLLTRPVEFDSQGNAVALIDMFPITEVRCGGIPPHFLNPPIGMGPAFESTEDDPDGVADNVTWQTVIKEQPVVLAGGLRHRELMVLDPKLRMLSTNWFFDYETKTLFTGDMFGHGYGGRHDELRVVRATEDDITKDQVLDHLMVKHSWLAAADTSEIVNDLDKQIERCGAIERIAPSNGAVLEGADVVKHHLDMMRELLADISQTREV